MISACVIADDYESSWSLLGEGLQCSLNLTSPEIRTVEGLLGDLGFAIDLR